MASYAPRATIANVAGLLTAPQLQANTVRLEVLAHLAVAHCAGRKKPTNADLSRWLNRYLERIARIEDPVEDVFVTNVDTPQGNRRTFEGIWESNDYFLQVVLDTLISRRAPKECRDLLQPAFALLCLSDCVAERLGLQRWCLETSMPQGRVPIAPVTRVDQRSCAVTFTDAELTKIGVRRELLTPFILREEDKRRLISESTGHSSLERRPLVDFGDALVLVLPSAVSPAIRRFVLSSLREMGYLAAFGDALSSRQARQVEQEGLWELKEKTESFEPPKPDDSPLPSFHAWLLKYDVNKYIHVVLLHDRLDWVDEQGFSSFLQYPEPVRAGLENYLNKVAKNCLGLPDCAEGMTLILLGGLGRGFMLGFKEWPEQWRLSVIRVSDLLMLAGELGQPIKRYLKCAKQKQWAEDNGVSFLNINGDFNFYCYWRRLNHQLVPRQLPVRDGSMISVGNDFVFPVRKELRELVDRHVVQTTSGVFAQAMRFGRDAYFTSMQRRPIYASLGHLRSGTLAGAVETSRGASWLIMELREDNESIRYLLYEIWSGFIGLFDRLVGEFEALVPQISHGPLDIRLDFRELKVMENYVTRETSEPIPEPTVTMSQRLRTAEIKFPSNFLVHFQEPENTGEKLTLRALARALFLLHKGTEIDSRDTVFEILLDKVIGNSGIRVLHLFHTYYPIEYLLSRQGQKPVFLAHEDFVFAKLKLSDGCTAGGPKAKLETKSESNEFLHQVVDKIWGQLRELLRRFDRASVIRQALRVHEAVIYDRAHWRRTAQAVIALYSSAEDVLKIAVDREKDRNQVALPARTVLEMAICECPISGGREISRWELDEVLAKTALLIEAATDSDAIKLEIAGPIVELHVNGEYTINREFHETVIRPFVTNFVRQEFEEAAGEYSKLYRRDHPGKRVLATDIYSGEFIEAFKAEFRLTPDEALDGFAELMEFAVEQDNVIVETTVGVLRRRLSKNRSLSAEACDAFFRTFGLFHREAWDKPPPGFVEQDLYPWRFRRRLSATVRPILIFGVRDEDVVMYGAGGLRLGFGYLLERTEKGQLPDRFFVTKQMKAYWGAAKQRRGTEFEKFVEEAFHREGWQARKVWMKELGAPEELGDIDVLAWKSGREVLLIECKRLQLARTVAEIAEICRRFQGEAKDELARHVKRVTWVNENLSALERITSFMPRRDQVDHRLVTSTHVPMKYLASLPIPPDKIGPLQQ
ncbi:MAG: hypothetical protein EWM72_03127 [Nitrospira sp.]|nr:MAG: hypothetical protein EWM72_03127 [Nitrospira sp.]